MTARSDIHRPAEFDPADYRFVGGFDNSPDYPRTGAVAREEDRLEEVAI